jgi:hypothetical protein
MPENHCTNLFSYPSSKHQSSLAPFYESNGQVFPMAPHVGANGQVYWFIDIAGMRFGSWTAIRRVPRGSKNQSWICTCDCGTERMIDARPLIKGFTTRCSACYGKSQRIHAYSQVWSGIIGHAKDRGFEVSVTRDHAYAILENQRFLCALTGLPIKIADSRRAHDVGRETTASLDRINSQNGYIDGNIWWVHKKLNIMKHTFSLCEFVEFCRFVSDKFPLQRTNADEGDNGLR